MVDLIGKRVTKLDAPEKAMGASKYVQDIVLPRMAHGKILYARRPHARIVSIDTSAARALQGVRAVITGADVPATPFGFGKDNFALKGDKVTCCRDEVAAVAADSPEIAEAACGLIEVEYEDLPAVFTAEDALAADAPVIHEQWPNNVRVDYNYSHGDVGDGEAESDVVVEGTFQLHRVTHGCIGPCGIIADFDSTGRLTVHSLTQVPFLYRNDLAKIVGMPAESIRIKQTAICGGFGSKLDIYPYDPICVFLARAAGRPVRLLFDREEEFFASPFRQPATIRMRSGAKKDGTLTFRDVDLLLDNGGRTSWGATTPWIMIRSFSSLYRVPHVKVFGRVAYTNNPYAGAFRGYGNPQATFAIESQIDEMAEALGIDPLEIRLKNSLESGEITGQGMKITSCGQRECLENAAKKSGWEEKRKELPGRKEGRIARDGSRIRRDGSRVRRDGSRIRRGIGMASLFHVGGGAKIYRSDGCGTILKIDDFGRVTLISGSSEIGQGSETVLAMIAAKELGLPLESIHVINNDTDLTPWDVGVHASRTTFIAGNSALRAARTARDKILTAAAKLFDRPADEMALADGNVVMARTGEILGSIPKVIRSLHFSGKHEMVVTSDYYEPPSESEDAEFKGNISPTYSFATQVAEVSVDLDTGVVRLERLTSSFDVGKVINQLAIEGQVEGGVLQGMGYALSEDMKFAEGKLLNANFTDYKMPTTTDLPELINDFVETGDPDGPYGAKGIGEAPLIPVAAAIANAVYHATGVRFKELPLTPERVFAKLRETQTLREAQTLRETGKEDGE